ncbi:MAG TPA: 1,2-phenylacetyl-CoA epoxidase subunit PaaC [Microbacterium sp.]|uniref:1,2-phenylacetyl-CoA epoxidase subunit PaaC n=1 Tax=Microbacterium sp. TaxID=51671 RepID=UPI002D1E338A|nr:1,2-phenylacetyl-CoA epoxidase subunit PaaC [Microbacterium sp.]HWI30604.1 1,2-phenylacetyl-CoA epoxidase subunit PaaC [Microbacterium sp.]
MSSESSHISVDTVALDAELVGDEAAVSSPAVAEYAIGLGDDALILAQQLGWWISRAPELEEDIALANIALDLLGHARSLLRYAGTADGRSEDDLAYWRDEHEYRSRWLFEQPNGDFAHTIVRQLLASAYFRALYDALTASTDPTLAAIAAKAQKEVTYHLDHAAQWMRRLALGTDESRRRTIIALTDLWPYLGELFDDDRAARALPAIAVLPSTLREGVDAELAGILSACGLDAPTIPFSSGGGREGRHSSYLGPLLAELQVLARQHPGASW